MDGVEAGGGERANPGLPWERPTGPAEGIGICLSGGGLRSSSFALGVVQALQRERGLLYGPNAARHLAAVSGGSYIAAAHTINAHASAAGAGRPPLARGSPEEQHILDHGRYLVQPLLPALAVFFLYWVANLAALVVLFAWAGTMVADVAIVIEYVAPSVPPLAATEAALAWLPGWVLVGLLSGSVLAVLYATYSESTAMSRWLPFPGFICVGLVAPQALLALRTGDPAPTVDPWRWTIVGAVTALALAAGAAVLLRKVAATGLAAAVVNWTQVVVVRLTGGVLLLWSATLWYSQLRPVFADDDGQGAVRGGLAFIGVLAAGLIFSYVPDQVSLHRAYRDRIRSCFGVLRDGGHAVPLGRDLPLSGLVTGRAPTPRLLICATLNVPSTTDGVRRAFAPFVMSDDVCGVPGTPAWFATDRLELGRPWFRPEEPVMTLFTAVAATGAAAAPSMGRMTIPSARPVLAALNARLGCWLPNPFSTAMRSEVESRTKPGHLDRSSPFGPGYNELIPEMLGISGRRGYVSDGGHYDNLGLMTLLRARCAEIWCVDASPDRHGTADELVRVLQIAARELRVTAEIDLAPFTARTGGFYTDTHVSGRLTYDSGAAARLHVIKLGLTAHSAPALRAYRTADRAFPHHPTSHQWYGRRRIEAYRDLGDDSATRALCRLADSGPV